jgi:hypothetical protein|nr:MAG TPA: hypothetical protein [Caudoviricetes sp.]
MDEKDKIIKELEAKLLKFKEPLNALNLKVDSKNKIERLDKFLTAYSELRMTEENKLLPSQKPILLYYLLKGISEDVIQLLIEDNPERAKVKKGKQLTRNHLHAINKKLRDRGYLVRDEKNYQKFKLSPDLETIRKKVLDEDCKLILMTF